MLADLQGLKSISSVLTLDAVWKEQWMIETDGERKRERERERERERVKEFRDVSVTWWWDLELISKPVLDLANNFSFWLLLVKPYFIMIDYLVQRLLIFRIEQKEKEALKYLPLFIIS